MLQGIKESRNRVNSVWFEKNSPEHLRTLMDPDMLMANTSSTTCIHTRRSRKVDSDLFLWDGREQLPDWQVWTKIEKWNKNTLKLKLTVDLWNVTAFLETVQWLQNGSTTSREIFSNKITVAIYLSRRRQQHRRQSVNFTKTTQHRTKQPNTKYLPNHLVIISLYLDLCSVFPLGDVFVEQISCFCGVNCNEINCLLLPCSDIKAPVGFWL